MWNEAETSEEIGQRQEMRVNDIFLNFSHYFHHPHNYIIHIISLLNVQKERVLFFKGKDGILLQTSCCFFTFQNRDAINSLFLYESSKYKYSFIFKDLIFFYLTCFVAVPITQSFTFVANLSELNVSFASRDDGEMFTNIRHFELPPRESWSTEVNFELR